MKDFDIKGAVRIISSNYSVVSVNNKNYKQLLNMHPKLSHEINQPDPPNETSIFHEVEDHQIQKAISFFPNGSASGFDGLFPQHLMDLTSKSANEQGRKLLENINKLVNCMLKGKVNNEIVKFLYGANLCDIKNMEAFDPLLLDMLSED